VYAAVERKGRECCNVSDRWEFMKGTMINAAEKVCGRTKGPKRH